MKFVIGLLLAIVSCFATIAAQRSASCLLGHSKNGNGVIACQAYIPSWSYNAEEDKCVHFIYGGCQGNANRFGTEQECQSACKL